jgi:AcrR family transcriptional regulator
MDHKSAGTKRQPRADATANRLRIVEVATEIFQAGGPPISLEAVARQAGIGIGTLYRHFPSRESLAAAVYHREVDELVLLAARLERSPEPVEALRLWLRATVEFVVTKKGMAAALALSARMPADLTAYSSSHLTAAVQRLLERATEECPPPAGLGAQDILRMLVALCYEFDTPNWQIRVGLLLDVFVNGLCRPAC